MDDSIKTDILKKIAFWGHGVWISALMMIFPPIIGMIMTIFGIKRAFTGLGSSGIGDPTALSSHISDVLFATLGGLIIALLGLVWFVISLVRFIQFRSLLSKITQP